MGISLAANLIPTHREVQKRGTLAKRERQISREFRKIVIIHDV